MSIFRLFLINKLSSSSGSHRVPRLPEKQYRNRRLYERFESDHKHLSLLNEQDILLIRNISESGLSCEVGARAFERLEVGDLYVCKIRYLKEVYDLHARVAWKKDSFLGFAFEDPSPSLTVFLQRLISPMRIGSSLQAYTPEDEDIQTLHFRGEGESDLLIKLSESQKVEAWSFEFHDSYVCWSEGKGLETGKLKDSTGQDLSNPWERTRVPDRQPDAKRIQFCADVFMVLNCDKQNELLASLSQNSHASILKIR